MKHVHKTLVLMAILIISFGFAHQLTIKAAAPGDILITEVYYDTTSDTTNEWIELYNPSTTAININGWTITDNSNTNTLPDVSIPSGGYYIIAKDLAGFQALYGFAADYDSTLSLNNGGDQLTLADASANLIDFVAWEGGYNSAYPTWTVSAVDTTIQRNANTNNLPVDTDTVADWSDSGTIGTPGSGYGIGDSESPLVSMTNPVSGSSVAGIVAVTCSATDNVGVTSLRVLVDSIEQVSVTSSSLSFNWDTTSFTDGSSHTVTCEAGDAAGNTGSTSATVTVNNSPASDNFWVYFTDPLAGVPAMTNFAAQEGNVSIGIVSLLNAANTSIDAALYHLSWQPVIDALNNAYARGVTVRVAYHGANAADFASLNPSIPKTAVTTSATMHNKFFVVDGKYVFTGSWNPTDTGTLFNANDAIKIKSTAIADAYTSEFTQLFANVYANSKVDNNAENFQVGASQVEVYFSPVDNGLARLIQLIDSSNISIYLSLFYLTDNTIYTALVNAIGRGVNVQLVADYRGWSNAYSEADELIAMGAGVIDANPGVYHHKFGVFDSQIVWTGSTNWSSAGFSSNDENSVVIHSAAVAKHYVTRTLQFWNDAVNYDTNSSAAPRIVTHHYSSWSYSNMIEWRPHMNGNLPAPTVDQYLLWRWNDTTSSWQFIRQLDWALSYYPDTTVAYNTMYYYCVSSVTNGVMSACSAEFGAQANSDGTNYQAVIYPATGHLASFGADTTSPVVTIVNPVNLATVSGYTDVWATVYDSSFVSTYEILIDGSPVAASSHYLLDTTTLSGGSHTAEIRATDIFGNQGSSSVTFTVDNTNYVKPLLDYTNVKVMTYNVNAYGQQLDGSLDFTTGIGTRPFMAVLKEENADILVMEETGGFSQFGNATLNRIAMELNQYFTGELPYSCVTAQAQVAGFGGGTVCSRFPIISGHLIPMLVDDLGNTFQPSHDFFDTVVQIGTQTVHIVSSHLKAKSGATNEAKREIAQEGILNYFDTLPTSNIIYAGDMNSYAPNEPCLLGTIAGCDLGYGPMNMTLNPSNPKASTAHTFYNAFRTVNPDTAANPGFTYNDTSYGNSVIDYLIVNDLASTGLINYAVSGTAGDTPSATTGSDHFSVDVTFDLTAWNPGDSTPPAQVTGLTSTAVSSSQINLTWTANTEPDLDHYNIYRDTVLIGQTTTIGFNDTGLSAATSYAYQVSAVDTSANEGVLSAISSATTDAASSGLNHVIISEVYYDATGSDAIGEWVELYNPTGSSVDLSGWTLQDNSGSFALPAGTIIAAGGFLVVARDAAGFQALNGFAPDVSGMTLSLSNSGDQVRLVNPSQVEVDFVAWEGYVAGWTITASTGQSIARANLTTDTDTVNDWIVLSNEGTPGA